VVSSFADICGSTADYTTTAIFRQKAQEEFAYLDTKLQKGSHVIIMGVVDGRVLWNTLVDAIHPVGTPYPIFYDYLNCMETSPCFGWMNSNESIRNASSAQAALLNLEYAYIMGNNTYENFDLHYFYMDYAAVIAKWVKDGHSALDLIEPVDGFHPSQTGNMLLASNMWDWLQAFVPESVGVENPNNDEIVKMFGDQGGYE
jgi:acyloxyacyl hydrolase